MFTAQQQLRSAGLRITAPRLAVLANLRQWPHSTADEVAGRVRQDLGGVSPQTIYDTLRLCAEHGLVRRIEPAGSPARFETRTADNHHHIVCRTCGSIQDVDCVVGEAPCMIPNDAHGYVIDEAEVVFWGACPRCQTKELQSPTKGCKS